MKEFSLRGKSGFLFQRHSCQAQDFLFINCSLSTKRARKEVSKIRRRSIVAEIFKTFFTGVMVCDACQVSG
jgi:hypothetical protein